VVFVAFVSALLFAPAKVQSPAAEYATFAGIPYRAAQDLPASQKDRCKVDLYYPKGKKGFATVVWFHGGGLTGGDRFVPDELKGKGIAVVAAGYRLSPTVKSPVYIQDAASAVAWTLRNIERYGGSRSRVFVSGHSAGGYLTLMVGLDRSWLAAEGVRADDLAGLIPFSGQCITHFTIRKELGIPDTQPVVDRFAPLFHVRKDAPPLLLITGDRNRELLGRYEENAYLWRMMKVVGHPDVGLFELQGFDHGGMAAPAFPLLLKFVEGHGKAKD
jgi:acetyl esterase/lipase